MSDMVRKLCFLLISGLFIQSNLFSQQDSPKYRLAAGFGFPNAPEHFHDYWDMGPLISLGYQTSSISSVDLVISGDYAFFSLNKERFLKGIQRDASSSSISGGNTTLISIQAALLYAPANQEYLPLFFLGGIGAAYSSIAESNATYSGLSVHQNSESYFSTFLLLGGGLNVFSSDAINVHLEGRFQIGLTSPERANALQSTVRIGIIREL